MEHLPNGRWGIGFRAGRWADRPAGSSHGEATLAVVGAGADAGGRQGAVDQERVAGAHLAQGVGWHERRGGGGEHGGASAELAGERAGAGFELGVAEELGDVAQGGVVAEPGVEDLGELVGEDGVGGAAVGGFALGQGLPDGDEQDADAGEGGCVLGQRPEGGVAGFVDDDQQGRLERLAGGGDVAVGVADEVVEQAAEGGGEAALVSDGGAEVERVRVRSQPVEVDAGPREEAATAPSDQCQATVCTVAYTDEQVRSSMSQMASRPLEASAAPVVASSSRARRMSRSVRTSPGPRSPGRSWRSTQSATVLMLRPVWWAT
jgi:hypothetical protein